MTLTTVPIVDKSDDGLIPCIRLSQSGTSVVPGGGSTSHPAASLASFNNVLITVTDKRNVKGRFHSNHRNTKQGILHQTTCVLQIREL